MLDIMIDEEALTVSLNEKVEQLKKLDKDGEYYALRLATDIASDLRTLAYKRYFSSKYNAKTCNSLDLSSDKFTNYKSRKKMVKFSLKNHGKHWKEAKFTAYPMNLYEEDTKVYTKRNPYISQTWGSDITYKRIGTHIMRQRLPNDLKSLIPINEAKFLKNLELASKKRGL